jgi:hypothetical protein
VSRGGLLVRAYERSHVRAGLDWKLRVSLENERTSAGLACDGPTSRSRAPRSRHRPSDRSVPSGAKPLCGRRGYPHRLGTVGITPRAAPYADLKSPDGARWFLVGVLFYFAARVWLEWRQIDPARRAVKAARLDYFMAHGIGLFALLLLVVQRALAVQVVARPAPLFLGTIVLIV